MTSDQRVNSPQTAGSVTTITTTLEDKMPYVAADTQSGPENNWTRDNAAKKRGTKKKKM